MLILIGLAILTGVLSYLAKLSRDLDLTAILVFMSAVLSGACLAIMILVLAICHLTAESTVVDYEITKATIEQSRENNELTGVERATITAKIIETNKSIASNRYWNEGALDIFIPDELLEMEYLK